MEAPLTEPLRFTRGRHVYIVARAYDGEGYIGIRDGRIVARDQERAVVARALINVDGSADEMAGCANCRDGADKGGTKSRGVAAVLSAGGRHGEGGRVGA